MDGRIRACLQDHGIGVAAEHLPFIFERFYRAPSNAGDSHSGGLGLAIAHAIAHAHGGSIECTSELGAGSSFTVVLPLVPVGQSDVPESKQKLIMG